MVYLTIKIVKTLLLFTANTEDSEVCMCFVHVTIDVGDLMPTLYVQDTRILKNLNLKKTE